MRGEEVGGAVFAADQTPHFHMTVENTVHKTGLADYQQLPSILGSTRLLKQPCLSQTTKMLLTLDK